MLDFNFNRVDIKPPKRYDSFMSGKVAYEGEKMVVDLQNVKLVSSKTAPNTGTLYCKIKLSRELEKFIMDLEERITDITTSNCTEWFKSRLNEETVDEYFQSSLTFDKKHRCLFKIRVDNPSLVPEDAFVGEFVDIKLRVSSVKFLKTTFWICYDVMHVDSAKARLSFQSDEEEDDTGSVVGVDEECGPDFEERERLRRVYIERLRDEMGFHRDRLQRLEDMHTTMEGGVFALGAFDAIENLLA